ncbi:MAG TPA: glycosyltransferase family 4 protein, partial [Polyangiaceae bacterium]
GIPIVWRAGGSRISLAQRIALWLLARFLKPDLLLCNGEAVRRLFHPLIRGPVAVVPNGVDPGLFGPRLGDPELYRPHGARLVVGFAGRLAASKHVEDVIALARRLNGSHPDVAVLIAGSGSEREACERAVREAGVENLSFLGFVSDMASFYRACDILVLPSDSEGSSNVLLEAMRSEVPVVAAAIPPILELVESGKTGLVYPLRDVDALAAAVEQLVADRELRVRLGREGARRVAFLTAEATASRLAKILSDVVAARATRESRRSKVETSLATTSPLPDPRRASSADPRIHASSPRRTG